MTFLCSLCSPVFAGWVRAKINSDAPPVPPCEGPAGALRWFIDETALFFAIPIVECANKIAAGVRGFGAQLEQQRDAR
jgi:hypothetical protein